MNKEVYFAEYNDCISKGDTLKEVFENLKSDIYSGFDVDNVVYYKATLINVEVELIEVKHE